MADALDCLHAVPVGRDTVSGEWTDTAVGLDGNHANIAMLQTPDGYGRLELFETSTPKRLSRSQLVPTTSACTVSPFRSTTSNKALEVAAKHGCHPLRSVATYADLYKLTYLDGPSGILVMLAEKLNKD
jgi:glyoxylase I family protein